MKKIYTSVGDEMKIHKQIMGTIECENRTYEIKDMPNKNSFLCKLGIHKFSKEKGGIGIWADFPSYTIIKGACGNGGCLYKICNRCGTVVMHGFHFG